MLESSFLSNVFHFHLSIHSLFLFYLHSTLGASSIHTTFPSISSILPSTVPYPLPSLILTFTFPSFIHMHFPCPFLIIHPLSYIFPPSFHLFDLDVLSISFIHFPSILLYTSILLSYVIDLGYSFHYISHISSILFISLSLSHTLPPISSISFHFHTHAHDHY